MNTECDIFSVVPVGRGLPLMMHLSVASVPLDALVSSIGLLNLGPSADSSSAGR